MSDSGLRRQTGALIVITPLVIAAILLLTALAIDGARLFAVRADMQSQINSAAAAAADAAQACGGATVSIQTLADRAFNAAQALGFDAESSDLIVQPGVLETSETNSSELVFRPVTDIAQSNATNISYSRTEPISRLLPEAVLGDITLTVNAAVRKEVVASISAAGSTTGIDNGLLGAVLGGILGQPGYSLDATDLESLGNTLFSVGDLLAQTGVDSLEDALPLGADELASAIRAVAGSATPAGDLADRLLSANGIESVSIGDVISVTGEAEVPQGAQFRTYDLLISVALNVLRQQQLLNGSPLTIDNLNGLGLPLASDIDQADLQMTLTVNRPPTVAVGPARQDENGDWLTRFYAADVGLTLDTTAELQPAINLLGIAEFEIGALEIPLSVDLGGGEGALVSARCAAGGNNSVVFGMTLQRQAVEMGTGSIDVSTGALTPGQLDADIGTLSLLAGAITIDPAVSVQAIVDGSIASSTTTEILDPSYPLYCEAGRCERIVYDQGSSGLSGSDFFIQLADVEVLGSGLDPGLETAVADEVADLLDRVVGSLLSDLVSPFAEALGIGIGGMQISIEAATQEGSQVVENVEVVSQ